MLTIEPMGGYFQVKLVEGPATEKTTASGLVVPTKRPDKPRIYEVVAAGPGTYNPFNGGRFDHGVKKGDLLMLNENAPVEIRHLNRFSTEEKTFLVAESDVFAVYMRNKEAYTLGLVEELHEGTESPEA